MLGQKENVEAAYKEITRWFEICISEAYCVIIRLPGGDNPILSEALDEQDLRGVAYNHGMRLNFKVDKDHLLFECPSVYKQKAIVLFSTMIRELSQKISNKVY